MAAPLVKDSLLSYLALIFGLLAWLVPDHYPPWGSFYNEFLAFLGLLMLLLFCARSAGHETGVPLCVVAIVMVAAVPIIQSAAGLIHFAGDGWIVAAYLLGLALAITAGFFIAKPDQAIFATAMAWLLVAGAAISALLAIHQALDLNALGLLAEALPLYSNRPYANLGQANQLATLLCMGLTALIYLRCRQQINRPALVGLGLLLIIGVVLTQSRAPWLGAACLLAWWLLKRKTLPEIKGWPIGIGLAIYAGLILFWPDSSITQAQKSLPPATTLPVQRPDLTEVGTHFQNWQEMSRAALKQPWTGYGWNQVTVAHVQNAHERSIYSELLSHSHNLLLDLVIWNGIPIGLLIIVGIGWWLTTRAWHCHTAESWFALAVLGFVGAHAMVEYPLDYAYFLLPVGLLVGLVETEHDRTWGFTIPRIAWWPVVIVYAVLMALVWHEYRIVETDYRLMRFETRRIGQLKANQPAPSIVLLTQLREDLRMARSLARKNMSTEELEWMRRITYRYPYYSSLFRYAVSLALNNRRQEASIEFRRLYDIYGQKPYEDAKTIVQLMSDTQYPELKNWVLP